MGAGKECGKTERWDLTKLVYKLKLTTRACRNLYISETIGTNGSYDNKEQKTIRKRGAMGLG